MSARRRKKTREQDVTGRYLAGDQPDVDPSVRCPENRLEPKPKLTFELRIGRQEREPPAGTLRAKDVAELSVQIPQAIALAHADTVRRVGDNPPRHRRRLHRGNRPL